LRTVLKAPSPRSGRRTNVKLRLLSRPGCHLCEVAARDLVRLNIAFDTIDVDLDEALLSRYGDVIPVLLDDEREIVRAPFTLPALRKALARAVLT
jgi:hypothetical protein